MANLDHDTNDFPRDDKGNLDTDDIYIKCQYGNQIYYYGRNDLVAYIPSIGRGHNILRTIALDKLQIEDKIPYEELYPQLLSEGTVKHIMENDEEIEFHFHPRDISYIATLLKASMHGADISPFSTRNLPKQKYEIPESDLEQYKQVVKDVPKDKFLIISRATSNYIFERMQCNSIGIVDNSYSGPQDCWKYPAIAMEDTVIHKNDRICQFRIMKKQPEIHFETVKELSGKSRGGFGSTGKN